MSVSRARIGNDADAGPSSSGAGTAGDLHLVFGGMRALALAAVLFLGGCASAVRGSTPPGPPRERPPADQVVFRVQTGGGLTSYENYANGRPTVTIYGDGTAFVATGRNGVAGYRPVALDRGTVPRAALAELIGRAGRSGLFAGRRDLGVPQVTDMPSTGVTFRPGSAPAREVSAYALSWTEGDDQLKVGQHLARMSLRALVGDLERAVTGTATWSPDRLDVTDYDSSRTGGATAWPGPPLDTVLRPAGRGRCGELRGADARRVYDAARRADSPLWRDGTTVRSLVIRALLPGERPCVR